MIHRNEEYEPVDLTRGNSQMAMIVSSAEYNAPKTLEECLLDKLYKEDSKENPQGSEVDRGSVAAESSIS